MTDGYWLLAGQQRIQIALATITKLWAPHGRTTQKSVFPHQRFSDGGSIINSTGRQMSITTKHQLARRVRFIHQIQSVAMPCWVKSNEPMQFHIVLWQFQIDIYAFCNFPCTAQVSNVCFSRRQLYAEDWVGHCVLLWCDSMQHGVTLCGIVVWHSVYESRGGVSYCGVTLRLGKGAGPLIYMHYRTAMLYILYQYVKVQLKYNVSSTSKSASITGEKCNSNRNSNRELFTRWSVIVKMKSLQQAVRC